MEAQRQVGAAGGRAERGIPAREAVPEAVATTGHPAVGSAFLLRQLPVLLGGAVLSANTELTNGRYQEFVPGRRLRQQGAKQSPFATTLAPDRKQMQLPELQQPCCDTEDGINAE